VSHTLNVIAPRFVVNPNGCTSTPSVAI
jgi:hypothetical protein